MYHGALLPSKPARTPVIALAEVKCVATKCKAFSFPSSVFLFFPLPPISISLFCFLC